MDVVICKICDKPLPSAFTHSHHTRPQATGGGPLDEILICPGCHDIVHLVANMLQGPKAGFAEDSVRMYYKDNIKAQRNCMERAAEAAKWFQLKKSGQIKISPDEEVEIIIKLPLRIKNVLQMEADAVRNKASGRKAGMANVAAGIITDFLYRKYPSLRKK